jgi:hypothetical protein
VLAVWASPLLEAHKLNNKKMSKERKVKSVQRYTFEIIHYEDNHSVMNRTNEGFSVIEMIGISEIIKDNLMCILKGAVKDTDEQIIKSSDSPIIHKPE